MNTDTPARGRITIAAIADTHYGTDSSVPHRRCKIADDLLSDAVSRLNRSIRPDMTLMLGDVLDDGESPSAEEQLRHMRSILDRLDSPYIAIPGNHDGNVEAFYRVFRRPGGIEDARGIRFVPFVDREEPGFNASRSTRDLARLHAAGKDCHGPIVTLQHVCLFPPNRSTAPYNYTNAEDVIKEMKKAGVILSVSGHYHPGIDNTKDGNVTFVNAPALCEAPFPFLVIRVEDGSIHTRRHQLISE